MEETKVAMPKCQSCGTQPLPIMIHVVNAPNGLILGVACCSECGCVIPCMPLGVQQQQPTIGMVPPELVKRFSH